MFRDEKQTHAAIRALLATLPSLGRLWTDTGPTDEAARTLEAGGPAMSTGEALLVRVAFDLWNKGGNAPLGHVINTLGNAPLAALGGLLVALTQRPEALDAWIARRVRPAEPTDYAARMTELAESFHVLVGHPGVRPWDAHVFDAEAATGARLSEGSKHCARFVLSVWAPQYAWKVGAFDLHAALRRWDEPNREAFLSWARAPWWH